MNDFTASNGVRIRHREGMIEWAAPGSDTFGVLNGYVLGSVLDVALTEAYRTGEDMSLGRWRWPENPDYVVYPQPSSAQRDVFGSDIDLVITRGVDGLAKGYVRADDQGGPPAAHRYEHILAARAYFDAHPEIKPWHAAAPGEVWEITRAGFTDKAWRLESGAFMYDDESFVFAKDIEAARRVFPEQSS